MHVALHKLLFHINLLPAGNNLTVQNTAIPYLSIRNLQAYFAINIALTLGSKRTIFWLESRLRKGSQFTSSAFTGLIKEHGIQISMDGKDYWRDNVFVERLWKSVKYEEIYLKAYDSVSIAKASLGST